MNAHSGYGNAESVLVRAATYKTAFRAMTIYAFIATVAAGLATTATVYLALTRPDPKYFATTSEGQILPLVPLDQPHQSNAAVANYAVTAVTSALTYSFDRYKQQFQAAQDYFTQPTGWNSFVKAVDQSDILKLVKKRRFNSTAIAQNAIIVKQGVNAQGVYEWIIQMPVRVTYQSASEVTGQNLTVTIYMRRLQTYQTPAAMAIDRFIAAPGDNR